ncbi:MAG: AbrB/MazE/SpoVT family DNA-binding domain-containing protein [Dehalococcoidia bacterium]
MQNLETAVTQKGQVTIPASVRKIMWLKPQDRVSFSIEGDQVVLSNASSKLLEGFEAVTPLSRPEDWSTIHEAYEQAVADEVVRGNAVTTYSVTLSRLGASVYHNAFKYYPHLPES